MTVISGGKVVAFAAVPTIDNEDGVEKKRETHGTPMLMQVSMVTTETRLMNSAEFDKAMEFITKSKDALKNLYTKGKDFYDKNDKTFKRIGLAFKALQGVGSIIGGIQELMPEKEDPMVANLAKLEEDVKALGEKLKENFNEMKNFISEQTFFTNIMSPTAVLTRHLRDCLECPGDDSKENFRKAYETLKPLRLQYNLNTFLAQKTTNPLRLSMDLAKEKTMETFEKWEDIYCRVMAQFMLLEAFASGLLGSEDDTNFDRLIEASTEILNDIEKWRDEYENYYWIELKAFLKPFMDERTDLNNSQKAEIIGTMLKNSVTKDALYMCIFNEAKWQDQYTYLCANESEQLIGVWGGKAKCNIFIYRSRSAHAVDQETYETMRNKVDECGKTTICSTKSLEKIIETQLIRLPSDGFIALIDTAADPQIFHFNYSDDQNKEPGHSARVLVDIDNYRRRMHLIVSFP